MKLRSRTSRAGRLAVTVGLLVLCVALACTGCGKVKEKRVKSNEPAPYVGDEWLDGIKTTIQENVHDPGRAGKMLEVVRAIAGDMRDVDEMVKKYYTDLADLNADYNSTPDDFRKLAEEFNSNTTMFRNRFLDNRFKLKDLATPEEWKKITDQDENLMEAWQKQPGAENK